VLYSILSLIIDSVASLLGGILLLRFWMQAVRVRPPSALAQFTYALTDWLVKPLRRLVAGFGGYDWASLIGAILIVVLNASAKAWLTGSFYWQMIVVLTITTLLYWVFYGWIGIILISVVFSWINPHAPYAPFFNALGDPLLKPWRRIIPLVGNVDLSPMVALLVLQIVLSIALQLTAKLLQFM